MKKKPKGILKQPGQKSKITKKVTFHKSVIESEKLPVMNSEQLRSARNTWSYLDRHDSESKAQDSYPGDYLYQEFDSFLEGCELLTDLMNDKIRINPNYEEAVFEEWKTAKKFKHNNDTIAALKARVLSPDNLRRGILANPNLIDSYLGETSGLGLEHIPKASITEFMALQALDSSDGQALKFVPKRLRNSKMIDKAIRGNPALITDLAPYERTERVWELALQANSLLPRNSAKKIKANNIPTYLLTVSMNSFAGDRGDTDRADKREVVAYWAAHSIVNRGKGIAPSASESQTKKQILIASAFKLESKMRNGEVVSSREIDTFSELLKAHNKEISHGSGAETSLMMITRAYQKRLDAASQSQITAGGEKKQGRPSALSEDASVKKPQDGAASLKRPTDIQKASREANETPQQQSDDPGVISPLPKTD